MTVRAYNRGHEIYYDEEKKEWFYSDDNTIAIVDRPCKRCGLESNRYGHDYCMQGLSDAKGVISACCGHGIENGYIVLEDGRRFVEVKRFNGDSE